MRAWAGERRRAGVDAGEHAHNGRRDDRAGREQEVAWLHVVAGGRRLHRSRRRFRCTRAADPLGVLDHDHRAGAVGDRRPVMIRIASPCPSTRSVAPAATSATTASSTGAAATSAARTA